MAFDTAGNRTSCLSEAGIEEGCVFEAFQAVCSLSCEEWKRLEGLWKALPRKVKWKNFSKQCECKKPANRCCFWNNAGGKNIEESYRCWITHRKRRKSKSLRRRKNSIKKRRQNRRALRRMKVLRVGYRNVKDMREEINIKFAKGLWEDKRSVRKNPPFKRFQCSGNVHHVSSSTTALQSQRVQWPRTGKARSEQSSSKETVKKTLLLMNCVFFSYYSGL